MIISNSTIRKIKSLRMKKFRDELGLFVVEGDKMVGEALDSEFEVTEVYRRDEIGEEAMSRLSSMSTPSPSLAVVRIPAPAKTEIDHGLFLALDDVRDPGNMGTIIRMSDWFGVEAIFASPGSVDIYNPKVVQASMGAIFRKKVITCDIPSICSGFRAKGLSVWGTFLDGGNIYEKELGHDGLIVMGNESEGISPAVRALVTDKLLIPSFTGGAPTAESLNVAIATAITLSEFKRRQ